MGRAKKEKCETLNVGEKVFGRLLSSTIPNVIRHDMTRSPAFPPPWQGTLPNLDLVEKHGHGGKHAAKNTLTQLYWYAYFCFVIPFSSQIFTAEHTKVVLAGTGGM